MGTSLTSLCVCVSVCVSVCLSVSPNIHLPPHRDSLTPSSLILRPLQAEGESSALRDGSLVDLCGATLLWRTGEGLLRAPTLRHLEALRQELNAARPQCPVGLSTLAFPSLPRSHR